MQRGRDLGRVVRIVIHHDDTRDLAETLEATCHALEFSQRTEHGVPTDPERARHGSGSQCVEEVVPTPHRDRQLADVSPLFVDGAAHRLGGDAHIGASEHRTGGRPVGIARRSDRRQKSGGPVVVRADDDPATPPDAREEVEEAAPNSVEVSIDVQVVRLEIRHDGDVGGEHEERPIVLVGFDHEEIL